jgi:uncharacterized coiled-coil DUF342 family protein
MARMIDDLDSLRAKLVELNARVRQLREENQQLRAGAASAQAELDALRARVGGAVQRVDALLARLPADAAPSASIEAAPGAADRHL